MKSPENGKPPERAGRKAKGSKSKGYDSPAASVSTSMIKEIGIMAKKNYVKYLPKVGGTVAVAVAMPISPPPF